MKITLFLFLIFPIMMNSQSLGVDRVNHLKKSVGNVIVDGGKGGTGSGFFIDENGSFVTNFHVIASSLKKNVSTGIIYQDKKIEIKLFDEKKIEMYLPLDSFKNKFDSAAFFDLVVLKPLKKMTKKVTYLKIGSFKDVNEGDTVLTCGFPLSINTHFISKGMISTKWVDVKNNMKRNLAWIDITMNKGNSGGPIIKISEKFEDDIVIGVASFILNPFAKEATEIYNKTLESGIKSRDHSKGLSMGNLASFNARAIQYSSFGISGCVSIDHLAQIQN
jgi:S1-C subfamily serine protease